MNRKRLMFYSLVAMPVITMAQGFGERSLPEPMRLDAAAADSQTEVEQVGDPIRIESVGAMLDFTAVALVLADETERAVRVVLTGAGRDDSLYLDLDQASQFLEELEGLEEWRARACTDGGNCTFGVARCRPSQAERQAFCPGIYHTADGEQGVAISTPVSSFRFPGVSPATAAAALEAAIGEHGRSD